jgi:hypothetical protein
MEFENTNDSYQGLLGLDRSLKETKRFHFVFCFAIASLVAVLNYFHGVSTIVQTPLKWVTWISPTCVAVAWLRLAGIKWRHALLLFIFVPIATFACISIVYGLSLFLFGD